MLHAWAVIFDQEQLNWSSRVAWPISLSGLVCCFHKLLKCPQRQQKRAEFFLATCKENVGISLTCISKWDGSKEDMRGWGSFAEAVEKQRCTGVGADVFCKYWEVEGSKRRFPRGGPKGKFLSIFPDWYCSFRKIRSGNLKEKWVEKINRAINKTVGECLPAKIWSCR